MRHENENVEVGFRKLSPKLLDRKLIVKHVAKPLTGDSLDSQTCSDFFGLS